MAAALILTLVFLMSGALRRGHCTQPVSLPQRTSAVHAETTHATFNIPPSAHEGGDSVTTRVQQAAEEVVIIMNGENAAHAMTSPIPATLAVVPGSTEKPTKERSSADHERRSHDTDTGRSSDTDGYSSRDGEKRDSDRDEQRSDRDGQSSDREGQKSDRDEQRSDRDGQSSDRDGQRGDIDGQSSYRDALSSDRDGRSDDRNERSNDREGRMNDRDGRSSDRDGRSNDKDGHRSDRDGYSSGRLGRRNDRDRHHSDRDGYSSDIDAQSSNGDGRSSDRDGRSDDRDRRSNDRDGRSNDKDRHRSDRDGYSSGRLGRRNDRDRHHSDRDGYSSDIDAQSSNGDGRSSDRDGRSDDRDRRSNDRDGRSNDKDRHRSDRDGYNSDRLGRRYDIDRHSSDRDGYSSDRLGRSNDRERQISDRDGHSNDIYGYGIDRDGHSSDKDGHSSDRDRHNSDRDGYSSDTFSRSNDRDRQISVRDGHSNDRGGQWSDTDGHSGDTAGHSSNIDGHSSGTDGHNSHTDGQRSDTDEQRTDRDGHSNDTDGHRSDRDRHSSDTEGQSSYIQIQSSDRRKQNNSRERQRRDIDGQSGDRSNFPHGNDREGKKMYVFDTEFLRTCAEKFEQDKTISNIDIDFNATSDFSQRTLIFDFRSDNQTTRENAVHKHRCIVFTKAGFKTRIWTKVLLLEILSNETVEIKILAKTAFTIRKRLELPVLSVNNRINMGFHWLGSTSSFRLELQYQVISDRSSLNDMKLTFTSPAQVAGRVRTPFWDGLSTYSFVQNTHLFLHVAPHDGVVISWEHLGIEGSARDCSAGGVGLVLDEDRLTPMSFCGHTTPPPLLLRCGYLTVAMQTHELLSNTGFSMRFSLHNDSALPQQLPDKTWNCSVPHWVDFSEHLLCNLLTECAGGEDEVACPYSGGTCPYGYWSAGGSCFSLEPAPRDQTSWDEADSACRRRGARLPTLNTEDKWRAVLDLLSHRLWQYIYVGLTQGFSSLPNQYSNFFHWSDQSVAYYVKANFIIPCKPTCAFLRVDRAPGNLYMDACQKQVSGNLLCERPSVRPHGNVHVVAEGDAHARMNSTRCPKGHVTHNFLSCDPLSNCFFGCYGSTSQPLISLPPSFPCKNKFQRVPFTLLCDHRADCSDASDEICVLPQCQGFECNNKQCIPRGKTCDGMRDCVDSSDESTCSTTPGNINMSKPLPAMVLHDGKGGFGLFDVAVGPIRPSQPEETRSGCPDSHFQCPGVRYYCLPVYVRCNGVFDCPGHQDEFDCDNFRCPGFYRCRGSKVCLHGDHLCDGIAQCPQRDDELMCGFVCPAGCTCYGMAFFCAVRFEASSHAGLRFLDARGSGMSVEVLVNNTMLFYLNLAKCNITRLETMNFVNVYHLDLSENYIVTVTDNDISSCKNLQQLRLAGNPIRSMFEHSLPTSSSSSAKLDFLDLSFVPIKSATSFETFRIFRNISYLNLSNTGMDTVSSFAVFSRLRVLDLRGCPVTYFTRSVFQGLDDLNTVYADNYKLCCPDTLPDGFNVLNCHAPFDEVSSCEGLLKSGLYRVSLSVLTSMMIVGNAGSFVYRVVINRSKKQTSFGLFVTNLCVSDFLMGIYSAAIGVADRIYLGDYVWNDVTWRRSATCKLAGVLSLVSNEVSVLIICLITIDRFMVIRFPFSRQLHFSLRSARVACAAVWGVGILLAVTPLLPAMSHWRFYSQTGICIPLPVTRRWFDGRAYSFGVLVVLNFVLFLVIATGQISIYLSVSANSIMTTSDTTQKAKDLTIARRLITVAVSDFLCWFPVGLLGILSSRGHFISGEASVVIAVFVLPLNSALNPFLYTVNVILEQRNRAREQRLLKMLLARHGGSTNQREGAPRKELSRPECV